MRRKGIELSTYRAVVIATVRVTSRMETLTLSPELPEN
nr:MAG TPA: hypothetical protein [Caudoviricetes sp.]